MEGSLAADIYTGILGRGTPGFEVRRRLAEEYVNSCRAIDISARQLYDILVATMGSSENLKHYDPQRYQSGPIILDVRIADCEMPDPYYMGHIPGALHIPWQDAAAKVSLDRLTKGRQIVVCSGNGQVGGQVAAILSVLGYDAINLRWGMSSWTSDPDAAPGRYDLRRDTIWHEGSAYRTVSDNSSTFRLRHPSAAIRTFPFPQVDDDLADETAGLATKAADYLSHCRSPNVSASEIYRRLSLDQESAAAAPPERQESPTEEAPILLDVRDIETYKRGYMFGSLHVEWKQVFRNQNLSRLATDRQIAVYSSTGHTGARVTALLNLLGYSAVNVRWGMAAWSLSLPGSEIAPGRYIEAKECMNYPTVAGYEAFVKCTT